MKWIGLAALALSSLPADAQVSGLTISRFEPWQASRTSAERAGRAGEEAYKHATLLLDRGNYQEALRAFDQAYAQNGARAEGALYWKAYCLNKLGRRSEAVGALAKLKQEHPNSRWSDDANSLSAELNQGTGAPAADDASNEELKLLAINGLLAADPERAIPQLEKLLNGNSSPKLKDRALFVLTQSGSPRANQVMANIAKGSSHPDLQMRAIRYIGMSGSAEARKQMMDIYSSSSDTEIKRAIIRSMLTSGASDQLLSLVTNEKDPALRVEAIRTLGMMNRTPVSLYTPDADNQVKRAIISGLFMSGDAKTMVDLARKETNPELKKHLVSQLALMHRKEATDYMMELLK